ncbi:protein of unknown function [Methylorubrum extorquens]|uniref:Uncharacterized protein n=1 Tax=Methylorubrum extorquens TaxID=408 RepID=A0A2N9AQD5_METEX|nr:protein of unknown function [Methylorubrum extorquens]
MPLSAESYAWADLYQTLRIGPPFGIDRAGRVRTGRRSMVVGIVFRRAGIAVAPAGIA